MRASGLELYVKYQGAKCRLGFQGRSRRRAVPLNLGAWALRDKEYIQAQQERGGIIDVGIYSRDFEPVEPLDLAVAGQALADNQADAVVLAPHDKRGIRSLDQLADFFWPLFQLTRLKKKRSPEDLVKRLIELNSLQGRCNLQFNWIAFGADSASYLIAEELRSGARDANQIINRYLAPEVGSLVYYHFKGEDNPVIDGLAKADCRVRLIELPGHFLPLRDREAVLAANGRLECKTVSAIPGPAVDFRLL